MCFAGASKGRRRRSKDRRRVLQLRALSWVRVEFLWGSQFRKCKNMHNVGEVTVILAWVKNNDNSHPDASKTFLPLNVDIFSVDGINVTEGCKQLSICFLTFELWNTVPEKGNVACTSGRRRFVKISLLAVV